VVYVRVVLNSVVRYVERFVGGN